MQVRHRDTHYHTRDMKVTLPRPAVTPSPLLNLFHPHLVIPHPPSPSLFPPNPFPCPSFPNSSTPSRPYPLRPKLPLPPPSPASLSLVPGPARDPQSMCRKRCKGAGERVRPGTRHFARCPLSHARRRGRGAGAGVLPYLGPLLRC